jgi:predicted membrane channel-forming protein YqfA (hemolysin III family)
VLAYDYPLLSVFWTLLEIAAFVIWIWLVIFVLIDIFRSRDMGGWAKALWVILVVLLPLLGVLIYLIARGGGMHDRAVAEAKQRDKEFTSYIQQTAQSSSVANQLDKLADLKASGAISDDEFQNAKAKILS